MAEKTNMKNGRFELATAAHHFLLHAFPFRQPDSFEALATFVATARRINVSPFDLDLVLLRCLTVLSEHTGHRIPSLLEQYVLDDSADANDLTRFSQIIERLLCCYSVSDGSVQDAMQLVSARLGTIECTPQFIAASVRHRLSTLDVLFKSQMGCTLTEYIRDVRLDCVAMLLATSNKSVKEVWAEVGYAYHSNFDHDFTRKFLCTPREYRARAIRPIARELYGNTRGLCGGDR